MTKLKKISNDEEYIKLTTNSTKLFQNYRFISAEINNVLEVYYTISNTLFCKGLRILYVLKIKL